LIEGNRFSTFIERSGGRIEFLGYYELAREAAIARAVLKMCQAHAIFRWRRIGRLGRLYQRCARVLLELFARSHAPRVAQARAQAEVAAAAAADALLKEIEQEKDAEAACDRATSRAKKRKQAKKQAKAAAKADSVVVSAQVAHAAEVLAASAEPPMREASPAARHADESSRPESPATAGRQTARTRPAELSEHVDTPAAPPVHSPHPRGAPPTGPPCARTVQSECVVCLDAPRTHVFLECMHRCVCAACAENILAQDEWRGTPHAEGGACPLCRVTSVSIRRVFD
jgi:hypothetical protein